MPPVPPPPPPPPSFKQKKNPLPNSNNAPTTVPTLPISQNLPPVETQSIQSTPMLAPITKTEVVTQPTSQNTLPEPPPTQTTQIPKLNTESVQNENSELRNLRGLDKWDIDSDEQRILEEEIKKPEEKKPEEKKDNPNENYNKAIQLGIKSLSFCSVPLEDEEEEISNKNVDPFLLRTLPFVIGTKEFFEDEHCGLKELLVEKEPVLEQENTQVQPTQDQESQPNPQETTSVTQEQSGNKGIFTIPDKLPGDDIKMDNMFGQDETTMFTTSETKRDEPPKEEKKPTSLFTEEPKKSTGLFDDIKRQPDPTDEFDLDSMMNDIGKDIVTTTKKKNTSEFAFDFGEKEIQVEKNVKVEEKKVVSALFAEEPTEKKKEKGMFDEEDLEEDEVVKKKKEKKPLTFSNDLFGSDDLGASFDSVPKKKENSFLSEGTSSKKKNDFDSFQVDDLLNDVLSSEIKEEPKKKEVKKEAKKEVKKDTGLFDEFLEEAPIEPKKVEKKVEKKATGLFNTDEFDEPDPLQTKKEEPKKVEKKEEPKKTTGLFDTEEEPKVEPKKEEKKDFQSSIIAGLQKMNQPPPKKEVKKDTGLFNTDEFDEPDPLQSKEETKKIEKKEEKKSTGLFEEEPKVETKQEPKVEVNEKKNFNANIIAGLQKMNTGSPVPIKKAQNNMFESDEGLNLDDPLGKKKTKEPTSTKKDDPKPGNLFVFGDDPLESGEKKKEIPKDLFEAPKENLFDFDEEIKPVKREAPKKKVEEKKNALFDTDFDEPDPLKSKKEEPKKIEKKEEKKSTGLFDTEEPKVEVVNEKKNFNANIIAGLQKMNTGAPMPIKKVQNNNMFESDETLLSKSMEKKKLTIVEEPKVQFESKDVSNSSRDGSTDKPILEHSNLTRSRGAKKRAPQKNLKVSLDSLDSVTVGEEEIDLKPKEEPKKVEKKEEPKKVEIKKEEPKIIKESPVPKKEAVQESPVPTKEPVKESPVPKKESVKESPTKETKESSKKEEDEFEIFSHKRTPKVTKEKVNKSQNLFATNMDELFDEGSKKETKKETKASVFDINEEEFLTKKKEVKKEEPKKDEPKKEDQKEMSDPLAKVEKKKEKKSNDFFEEFDIPTKKKDEKKNESVSEPVKKTEKKKASNDFFGDIMDDPLGGAKKETKKKTNDFFD